MNRMKKGLLIGCCVALLSGVILGGIFAYYITNYPYTNVVEVNWGIVLPVGYEEVYGQETEASFHGDGIRYHVLQYADDSVTKSVFAFSPKDGDTYKSGKYSEASEAWLDEIAVPAQWRPVYDKCSYYYVKGEYGLDEAIFMWDAENEALHVVESFM